MAKYLSPDAKAKRKKRRQARRLAVFMFLSAFVLVAAYGIVMVIEHFTVDAPDLPLITPTETLKPNEDLASQGDWKTHTGPVQQTINTFEITSPDHRMIQLPENGSVDISYFDTAVFVGDSLTEGLRIYPTVANSVAHRSKFVSTKGITPKSFLDPIIQFDKNWRPEQNGIDAICEALPDKVYITLGTNALVYMTDEAFMTYYNQFIDVLLERLSPGVIVYICSITPTTEAYAIEKPNFSKDRIYRVNSQIAKMASQKGVNYINLHEALTGEDGYTKAEYSAPDNLHLSQEGYAVWIEYLMRHTVHRPNNPYIPGSPYYRG